MLLPAAVALPMLGAVVLAVAGRWLPRVAADALALGCAAGELAVLAALWVRTGEGRAVAWVGGWEPVPGREVGVVLATDRIGVGLALLAGVLVPAALGYAWRYFDEPRTGQPGAFPALILLFEAGMCGFVLTGDLFDAFVFFELMGVAAYALTGFRVEDPRPLQGALAFALTGSLAGYCVLLGTGLLYARTGELAFARIGAALAGREPDALVVAAFALLAAGLLVKGAAVPFHFWLPDAHAMAPTPVCMLLSGVMVELGVYGLARTYGAVFAGPGGIPQEAYTAAFVALGVLTALVGAVLCWQQRHLKRLLAFSTVAHVGLFLVGVALLEAGAAAGTAVYAAGHAAAKAALFALVGVLLDQHGSVDEHGLYGRGRDLPFAGVLFGLGGLAVAGLPPFGTGLGKALAEHAAGQWAGWLVVVFVVVSAVTGGAVLRAGARVFVGAGPRPPERRPGPETAGFGEEPEVRDPQRRVPGVMLAVPALLLAGSLAVGVLPGVGRSLAAGAAQFTDGAGYARAVAAGGTDDANGAGSPGGSADASSVDAGAGAGGAVAAEAATKALPESGWTRSGVLLGLLSAALAAGLAAAALWGPELPGAPARRVRAGLAALSRRVVVPLRRLHSGHIGDYATWLAAGVALLMGTFGLATR